MWDPYYIHRTSEIYFYFTSSLNLRFCYEAYSVNTHLPGKGHQSPETRSILLQSLWVVIGRVGLGIGCLTSGAIPSCYSTASQLSISLTCFQLCPKVRMLIPMGDWQSCSTVIPWGDGEEPWIHLAFSWGIIMNHLTSLWTGPHPPATVFLGGRSWCLGSNEGKSTLQTPRPGLDASDYFYNYPYIS